MQYRWDDCSLDRDGTLLTRQGRQVDISRKVLGCLCHLVENRDRVVSYDELIRKIWGHDNVTNHQLAQVILSARRALGDDGQAQRLIRTMPGLGYRWVGAVVEVSAANVSASTPPPRVRDDSDLPVAAEAAAETRPAPPLPEPVATGHARGSSRANVVALTVILLFSAGVYLLLPRPGDGLSDRPPSPPPDPVTVLNDALREGKFDVVREGLATLPPYLTDAPDMRILEIELDLSRGRLNRVVEKLEGQLARPETLADPLLRARLLILKARLSSRMGNTPAEALALAQSILALLDMIADGVPAGIRAQALERRAAALIDNDQLDDALRDLAFAHDLFKSDGDVSRAIGVKLKVARVWMRMGRLQDALNASRDAAEAYRRRADRLSEMFALNTMSRIQMELLRWDDALASNDRVMQLLHEVPHAERRYRSLQLRALVLTAKGQLRLAESQLDEAAELRFETQDRIIPAFHRAESGDPAGALRIAAQAFDGSPARDDSNILLDSKDGALLLWITAAQNLAGTGVAYPVLPPEYLQRLQNPKTGLARIARGRWLWSQGKRREAETELRRALDESRRMNHLFRMTLAAEPLLEMLLHDGDVAAAQALAADLRAFDPDRMDSDYRACLLRLRVALATGDSAEVVLAYDNAARAAGERSLPSQVLAAYRKLARR